MARLTTGLIPDLTVDNVVLDSGTYKLSVTGLVSYKAQVVIIQNTAVEVENFNDGAVADLIFRNNTGGDFTLTLPTGNFAIEDSVITVPANGRTRVICTRISDSFYWTYANFVAIT